MEMLIVKLLLAEVVLTAIIIFFVRSVDLYNQRQDKFDLEMISREAPSGECVGATNIPFTHEGSSEVSNF